MKILRKIKEFVNGFFETTKDDVEVSARLNHLKGHLEYLHMVGPDLPALSLNAFLRIGFNNVFKGLNKEQINEVFKVLALVFHPDKLNSRSPNHFKISKECITFITERTAQFGRLFDMLKSVKDASYQIAKAPDPTLKNKFNIFVSKILSPFKDTLRNTHYSILYDFHHLISASVFFLLTLAIAEYMSFISPVNYLVCFVVYLYFVIDDNLIEYSLEEQENSVNLISHPHYFINKLSQRVSNYFKDIYNGTNVAINYTQHNSTLNLIKVGAKYCVKLLGAVLLNIIVKPLVPVVYMYMLCRLPISILYVAILSVLAYIEKNRGHILSDLYNSLINKPFVKIKSQLSKFGLAIKNGFSKTVILISNKLSSNRSGGNRNGHNAFNIKPEIRTIMPASFATLAESISPQIHVDKLNPLQQTIVHDTPHEAEIHTQKDLALCIAAQEGNLPLVKWLVARGANIRTQNDSPLLISIQKGQFQVAQWLAEQGADIRVQNDRAIIIASQFGHLEIVKWLQENGADIRAQSNEAFCMAVQYGHLSVAKWLATKEADIRVKDDRPLQLAALKGQLAMVQWLAEKGVDIRTQNDLVLCIAAQEGHLPLVKYLVTHGAKVSAQNDRPLNVATGKGHLPVVQYLLEMLSSDFRTQADEALCVAANNGHLEIVKWLYVKGANISAQSDCPLFASARYGHLKVMKWLVSKGVDVRIQDDTALFYAVLGCHFDIVEWLVEEQGVDVTTQRDRALCIAAQTGNLQLVQWLVKHGADIHAQDDKPLIHATQDGYVHLVEWLISRGANIRIQDDGCLIAAAGSGHLRMVQYLIINGADVSAQEDLALVCAAKNGHLDVVKCLVEQGVNIKARKIKALYGAAEYGQLAVVKWLVAQGANIRSRNYEAFLLAAENGQLAVVEWLVAQNAIIMNKYTRNIIGFNLLQTAAQENPLEFVCFMMNFISDNLPAGFIVNENHVTSFQSELDNYIASSTMKCLFNRLACYKKNIISIEKNLKKMANDVAKCVEFHKFRVQVDLGCKKIEIKIATKLLDYRNSLFFKITPETKQFDVRKTNTPVIQTEITTLPKEVFNEIMSRVVKTTPESVKAVRTLMNGLDGIAEEKSRCSQSISRL